MGVGEKDEGQTAMVASLPRSDRVSERECPLKGFDGFGE